MPVVGVAPTVVGAGAEGKDVGAEGISYLEVVGDGIDVCIDGGFCGGGSTAYCLHYVLPVQT